MLLPPIISSKKSAKILEKPVSYLAIAITIFNLFCSLFKTTNFQPNTHISIMDIYFYGSIKTISYSAVGTEAATRVVLYKNVFTGKHLRQSLSFNKIAG